MGPTVEIHRGPTEAGDAALEILDEHGTLELPHGVRCRVDDLLF